MKTIKNYLLLVLIPFVLLGGFYATHSCGYYNITWLDGDFRLTKDHLWLLLSYICAIVTYFPVWLYKFRLKHIRQEHPFNRILLLPNPQPDKKLLFVWYFIESLFLTIFMIGISLFLLVMLMCCADGHHIAMTELRGYSYKDTTYIHCMILGIFSTIPAIPCLLYLLLHKKYIQSILPDKTFGDESKVGVECIIDAKNKNRVLPLFSLVGW